jgi:hypothetical protein
MMTAENVAHLLLTAKRVVVVLLDGRVGFLHRCPMPESTSCLVRVPGEESIEEVPLKDLAVTECEAILAQADQCGGLGAWPMVRQRLESGGKSSEPGPSDRTPR